METKQNTKGWTAKPENEKKTSAATKTIHNLIIVDESGSMSSLYNVALTGMNETLETIRQAAAGAQEQRQEVTLVTFDSTHYNKIFDSVPAGETRKLTTADYHPCACTPLYDAMGRGLTELERKVKENESVLVTVITDGYENASCEFSLKEIRALVERLDKAGWLFSYIGANQDSAAVGQSMGISDTLDFEATEAGMNDMWVCERESRKAFYNANLSADFSPVEYQRGSFFKKKKK